MRDLIELMAPPFAACVVLVGIHAYLGLHVIQRKVIFVDLALAQIAALGATFGVLLGLGAHGKAAYLFSLAFAIVGAAIFAMTRMRHERIPQEAIIGIVYAVALALAILVADRAPEGAEHIKETLTGSLLWVRWPTIVKTALIYLLVGALHFVLRRRFFQISFAPEEAYAEGRSVRLWDFIFYVTFAFVITSSVAIAGVLVVFSFLVIPAVIATLFAERISTRLIIGWSVGLAACVAGLVASYRLDFPSGPAVVASLGGALVVAGLIYAVVSSSRPVATTMKIGAALAVALLLGVGFAILVTSPTFLQLSHEHDWEREESGGRAEAGPITDPLGAVRDACGGSSECMAERLQEERDWAARLEAQLPRLAAADAEPWIETLGAIPGGDAADLLAGLAIAESDPLLRIRGATLLADRGDPRGIAVAVELLGDDSPPLVRDEAYELVTAAAGEEFGYDPFGSAEENAAALERIGAALP